MASLLETTLLSPKIQLEVKILLYVLKIHLHVKTLFFVFRRHRQRRAGSNTKVLYNTEDEAKWLGTHFSTRKLPAIATMLPPHGKPPRRA